MKEVAFCVIYALVSITPMVLIVERGINNQPAHVGTAWRLESTSAR